MLVSVDGGEGSDCDASAHARDVRRHSSLLSFRDLVWATRGLLLSTLEVAEAAQGAEVGGDDVWHRVCHEPMVCGFGPTNREFEIWFW